ncbi:MAG: dTMP kinase [Candidatus Dormiibacterota bacterium]
MAGRLVTLEGPEGAGKTTQLRLLRQSLAASDPLIVREPGDTALGERVREILLHGDGEIGVEAEMYLFMAARAELLEERIRPALQAGRLVLCDRYHDATRVYQGIVGGATVPWPPSFPRPALTALLLVPPEVGRQRQAAEGKAPDRLEARPLAYHRRVADAYRSLAAQEPERWIVLDGEQPPEQLCATLTARIERVQQGTIGTP